MNDNNDDLKPINSNEEDREAVLNKLKLYAIVTIKVVLSIIALGLTWDCNKNNNVFLKIIFAFMAIVFSEIYILYYAIYRICMGNKCPV